MVTRPNLEFTDEQLRLWLKKLVLILGGLLAVFTVIYLVGQRLQTLPSESIPDSALTKAEAAVRQDPNNIPARIQLAAAYARVDDIDRAQEQLQEVLRVQPENRTALIASGLLYYQTKDYDKSLPLLQTFVEGSGGGEFSAADKQLQEALYTIGLIYWEKENYEKVAQNMVQALQIDDSDADAWYWLGEAQLRIKLPSDAATSFQKVLAFVPSGWCEPYAGLSKAFADIGDENGQTYASAMVAICDGGGQSQAEPLKSLLTTSYKLEALIGLGQAAEHDKATEDAVAWYRKAVKIDPENVIALNALSRLGEDVATPSMGESS